MDVEELEGLIIGRLRQLGFSGDIEHLDFLIAKAKQTILNMTNQCEVPRELRFVLIDMVVGEFLSIKKAQGNLEDFDVEAALKTVKQGDTSVTYAVTSDSVAPFHALLEMLTDRETEILGFRRVRGWHECCENSGGSNS